MAALTKPRPVLDTRQPATKPGTWGSQPPHMRLTDVENFARRLPTRATRLTTPETTAPRGTFSAAHLTDVPPYEERDPCSSSSGRRAYPYELGGELADRSHARAAARRARRADPTTPIPTHTLTRARRRDPSRAQ